MTRVDFYVLGGSGSRARDHFACRLAEKAWKQDNAVFIRVANLEAAKQLDEMMWTFRDGSFVPHEIAQGQDAAQAAPVRISSGTRVRAFWMFAPTMPP